MALRRCRVMSEVVAAFDVNEAANRVYLVNFGLTPQSRNLETLSAEALDELGADLFMMSPPCQPFTRSNDSGDRDRSDPRSKALLNLIEQMSRMSRPPAYFVLENVVGFESSECCALLLATLKRRGYSYQQYHLTPSQLGIPNDRPRYYCIARLHLPFGGDETREQLLTSLPHIYEGVPAPISDYLHCDISPEELTSLQVPEQVLSKSAAWCFDIVSPGERRSSCFTKAYSKFIRGSGSVLFEPKDGETSPITFLHAPEHRMYDGDWRRQFNGGTLRYFSPKELQRIFGFPAHPAFRFPDDLTHRKCFELLGNSLSVFVATELLNILFDSL